MRQLVALSIVLGYLAMPRFAAGDVARDILDASGVEGGLIVHVGCADGKLTASMCAGESYRVHGLDTDADRVAEARDHVASLGCYGKVLIETFGGSTLPYADSLVNLLVSEDLGDVPMDEVMRVLAPRGVAYVKSDGGWTKSVKPWPQGIDEWTHYLHDSSGNAVAHDRVVAAPRHLQWIGGPLWSRSHEYDSSLCAMVSANGRIFYIFDEGPTGVIDPRIPDRWMLIARDAFNGIVLWKRPISDWGWRAWKRADMEQVDWRRMPSQRFRLPVSIPRRLVSAGDRVYVTLGYQAPLTVMDAATGQTTMTYAGTERTDEILHESGLLVLCIRTSLEGAKPPANGTKSRRQEPSPGYLLALEAETGRRLWQTEPGVVVPLSPSLSPPHVLYHDGESVVCLDAASGEERWRTATGIGGNSIWNTDTTLVVHKGVVLSANRKQLTGLSVNNGQVLWKQQGATGFGVANPPDLFVADDVVWYGRENLHAESITGCDLLTGNPVRRVDLGMVITRGHHARCYRSKATDNYLLLPKRAVEFIDIKGEKHSRHNWVRGACRYGILPCNGLLYSTPHPCFCYAGVKLGGFLALAPEQKPTVQSPESKPAQRLDRGPAYANVSPPPSPLSRPPSEDWPMYRHDPERSGSGATAVRPHVSPVWKRQLEGNLTQPVVVGQQLFVARIDAGQICCLDAATGQSVWEYITGGRIDSAPTYYKGRLIFGSADGYVYCLRASDGALAWRFRAAPDERRVVAFGQVESAWPVHGSVLVTGDVVYFSAGRSSFLDDGIVLYGLDPVTGEKRYQTRIDGPYPDVSVLDENAYAMEGAKSDILVTDGTLIYLFHNAFNRQLQKQATPITGELGVRNLGVRDFGEHLFSNAGFLDRTWFSRSHWMYGNRWPAFNFAHQSPKSGQLVVFDDNHTYAVKCFARRNLLSPLFFPATDGYLLFADGKGTQPVLVNDKHQPDYIRWLPQTGELQTCWNLGVGFARSESAKWVKNISVRVRAMVCTSNALFAAGPPDVCDPDDPAAALEGRMGALLLAFNPDNGERLFEYNLDTPPIFDGMAAAQGRLYVSLRDGSVLCLAGDGS